MSEREHVTNGKPCWCAPNFIKQSDGSNVVVHRQLPKTDDESASDLARHQHELGILTRLLAAEAAQNKEMRERFTERVAQMIAHRVCCAAEHDPQNGKLHGCCAVCCEPWPCAYAGNPPALREQAGEGA